MERKIKLLSERISKIGSDGGRSAPPEVAAAEEAREGECDCDEGVLEEGVART
jgi:hypothetical protein